MSVSVNLELPSMSLVIPCFPTTFFFNCCFEDETRALFAPLIEVSALAVEGG
jgi:hypothetical protein